MSDKFRRGHEWVCVNPFTPEEEWICAEEFDLLRAATGPHAEPRTLRITKIDLASKTVTLG